MDTDVKRNSSAAILCGPSGTTRRSFLLKGIAAGAAGSAVLTRATPARAAASGLPDGDVAILRFLAAVESVFPAARNQRARIDRNTHRHLQAIGHSG